MSSDIRTDVLILAGGAGYLIAGTVGMIYGLVGISALSWITSAINNHRRNKFYVM